MKTYKSNIPQISLAYKSSDIPKAKITKSREASEYARQFYFDDLHLYESFFILLLNKANNTIGWVKISQGGVSGTVADPKIIAKYAVESLASSVILIHNHPSGNIRPSEADKRLTKQVSEGLRLLDIAVLDHIIIGEDKFFSFTDEGLV